ncbi:MAG: dTMP kinase [Actinomycetota bacterium]
MKGLFITFEGLDGSGKTTQIKLLCSYLKGKGHDVISTIEPGGTEVGQKIRKILLNTEGLNITPKAETFLFLASRAELVSKVINPAMDEGKIIICDRFFDSTIVYQGIARNLGKKKILDMSLWATGSLVPDITFLLSVRADEGEIRKKGMEADRMEKEESEFKKKVYEGYLELARDFPERFVVIDGEKDIESIFGIIKDRVEKELKDR